jgi:hypothetical protein
LNAAIFQKTVFDKNLMIALHNWPVNIFINVVAGKNSCKGKKAIIE